MADFEDDNEFNSTQIQNLVGNVIATIFNADTVYDRLKVNQWTQQIIESVIKELAKLDKPMKYIVTCVIQQNNGAGMQSAATCTWDVRNDGLISIKTDINAINLFCTVYAITI
jgi:dynein light chain Tctex-type 1